MLARHPSNSVVFLTAFLALACAQQRVDQSQLSSSARFGRSVSISGVTAAVSAYQEDGNQGSVYLYTRFGAAWSTSGRLVSPSPGDEQFGYDVAISGSVIVVGAPLDHQPGALRAGSAYVFEQSGNTWTSTAQLASGGVHQAWEAFGGNVAVDGTTIVVGAVDRDDGGIVDAGAAYIFTRTGGAWSLTQTLTAPSPATSDKFGSAVAIAGNTLAVAAVRRNPRGVDDAGAVFVYERTGPSWTLAQALIASDAAEDDLFGTSVALTTNASGDRRLIVGAESALVSGHDNAGAAYVFDAPVAGTFTQTAKLVASDPAANALFGTEVALSFDRIVIGASSAPGAALFAGAAYVFSPGAMPGTWSQIARLDRSPTDASSFLGSAVAIGGGHALIGATGEEVGSTSITDTGAAHAFREHDDGTWAHSHVLHASSSPSGTWYGSSLALAAETAVVASALRADAFEIDLDGLSLTQPIAPLPTSILHSVATDDASIAMFERQTDIKGNGIGLIRVLVPSASGWSVEQTIEPDLVSVAGPSESANSGVVAILGDTLAIGAPRWNGGDGRVFVWTRSGGIWSQLQVPFVSPNAETNFDMNFGRHVALDGNTLVIAEVPSSGLPVTSRNGNVFVYVRTGMGPYVLQQVLHEPTPMPFDRFGASVAISGDLLAVLTGATSTVRVYRRTAGAWSEIWNGVIDGTVPVTARQMLDIDGDRLAVGVPRMQVGSLIDAGEVRVYARGEDDTYDVENVLRAFDPAANRMLGHAVQIHGDRVLAATLASTGGVYAFPL